jgi:succinate dehydrogenase flavin-adding protein (antitoxin of CptAB toxin-antitoxin module)
VCSHDRTLRLFDVERRGLLELDIVLQRFLQRNLDLKEEEVSSLKNLLALPDNDLWDIVIGRSEAYQPHLNEIVARLRAA